VGRGIAYVAGEEALSADLQTLDATDEFDVTPVQGSDRGVERPLPEHTDCVVVDHDPPAVDALAVAAWITDRYAHLPIVLYPTAPSEALAGTAVNVGFDAYVTRSDGGSTALLRSHLRRLTGRSVPAETGSDEGEPDDSASDSGPISPEADVMFEALLTNLPRGVSIYVKDRLGRHVAVSGSDVAFDEEATVTTPDGKVLHSREDILRKTDFDLYPSELATQTREQEQRIMRTEEPDLNVTETVADPSGGTQYYSTTKAPWYDESGSVAGIVGITVDITDRIEREHALERQNERLDRFADVLSHDLRNPLSVASGQVEILDALEELPAGAEKPLDDLEWSLDRIEALVEDTLRLARQGSVVDDPEPTDVADVARNAWRCVDCEETNFELDDPLPLIAADPDRLQELLENLFRNASQHARPEDGSITVTVGGMPGGVYVADDGVGIPVADRESVFEEGYTTESDGTGFGLAIVREIAEAHDWSVAVTESSEGGTRFEFTGVNTVK